MRHLTYIIILISLSVACGRSVVKPDQSGICYFVSGSSEDQIELETIGYGEKRTDVLEDGIGRALKAVLYQGIPDSPYRNPLINDPEIIEKNKAALSGIINGYYDRFVTQTRLISEPERPRRNAQYSAKVRTTINLDLLKRHLTNKGILPRYGL